MKKITKILIPVFLIGLVSCKKDNQDPIKQEPIKALSLSNHIGKELLNTEWQITSMIADTARQINGQKSRDWFSIYKPCRKDNKYVFSNTDNLLKLSIYEEKELCSKESQTVNTAMLLKVNDNTKTLKGATNEEGANKKMFDTPEHETSPYSIEQEWQIKELTTDKMKVVAQILEENPFVEYTAGKPTIEIIFKRVK